MSASEPRSRRRVQRRRSAARAAGVLALLLLASAVSAQQDGGPGASGSPGPAGKPKGRSVTPDVADAEALAQKPLRDDEPSGPTEAQLRSRSYWLFEAPVPTPEELAADPDAHAELLERNGIALDVAAQTVSVRGGVVHDRSSLEYPIEYLITTERGKTYESAFLVRARPKLLDACLQAVGLEPGTGMSYEFLEPPPEDTSAPDYLTTPASGPLASIDVTWIDDGGRAHRASLESMLIDALTGEELQGDGWIYIGSRTALIPRGREDTVERFMADIEGNLVAIYLDGRGTCLFERNSLRGIDTPYTLHPERMPPRSSSVTLHFHPTGGFVEPREAFAGSEQPTPDQLAPRQPAPDQPSSKPPR